MAKSSKADRQGEIKEVETALEKGFAEVKSEDDAAKVLSEVEAISGEAEEKTSRMLPPTSSLKNRLAR